MDLSMARKTKKAKRSKRNGRSPDDNIPVFDLKNRSWADELDLQRLQIHKSTAEQDYDLDELDYIEEQINKHIIQYVVSVPDEWLADGHPPQIDWNEPGSLDWLAGGRFLDLVIAMGDVPETDEKPVFDLKSYRRKDAKLLNRLMLGTRNALDNNDLDLYDKIADDLSKHLIRFVVSVPDEWLVNGCSVANWDDHNSLNHLGSGRYIQLIEMMSESQVERQKK